MRVAICGLGPSLNQYVELTKRLGSRRKLADETWGINAVGDVIRCDAVIHMDDVRIQERRAAAAPESNIAAMLQWMRTYPGPIYTSVPHPDYPGTVAYPLQDVVRDLQSIYFNSTAAYAVALAIHRRATEILCFGMDFTYPNAHDAEQGRGCVEFWLGVATARGIKVQAPKTSSLLDACYPEAQRWYGYDMVTVRRSPGPIESTTIEFEPRPDEQTPTADEIERRYDHSLSANPLVRAEQEKELDHA
jgi:hypothetical protein